MEIVPDKPTIKSGKRTYTIALPQHVAKPHYGGVAVKARKAREIAVLSNHYNLSFPKTKIYQWNAKFDPELPEDSREVINDIFFANTREILTTLGKFVNASNCIFTFELPVDKEDVKLFTFSNHPKFKITLARLDKNLDFK